MAEVYVGIEELTEFTLDETRIAQSALGVIDDFLMRRDFIMTTNINDADASASVIVNMDTGLLEAPITLYELEDNKKILLDMIRIKLLSGYLGELGGKWDSASITFIVDTSSVNRMDHAITRIIARFAKVDTIANIEALIHLGDA